MSQSVNGYPEYLTDLNMPGVSDIPAWKRFSEILRPPTSRLFVFIDEHQNTLLDAQFGNPVGIPAFAGYGNMWFDMPSDRHNQGGCLAFADSHAERWHWKLTWLRGIEMLGLVSAGQFLVVDLALQLHERV